MSFFKCCVWFLSSLSIVDMCGSWKSSCKSKRTGLWNLADLVMRMQDTLGKEVNSGVNIEDQILTVFYGKRCYVFLPGTVVVCSLGEICHCSMSIHLIYLCFSMLLNGSRRWFFIFCLHSMFPPASPLGELSGSLLRKSETSEEGLQRPISRDWKFFSARAADISSSTVGKVGVFLPIPWCEEGAWRATWADDHRFLVKSTLPNVAWAIVVNNSLFIGVISPFSQESFKRSYKLWCQYIFESLHDRFPQVIWGWLLSYMIPM